MSALEILLAESQERMCYEVAPEDVDRMREIAERFDLGCSVIGEVTEGNYVCTMADDDGGCETVVDVDAEFLGEGAPFNDLPTAERPEPERSVPEIGPAAAVETVLGSPNTASKRWVYRQYDHEVGVRTATRPGDDAAVLAIHETAEGDGPGTGLALASGADPNWTDADPYEGARAVALENATNLAVAGARPLAAVDCLNGGNPEKPAVYGGFADAVDGLADMCMALSVPVVGGNVSLYNDSPSGPIPPTPTVTMVGTREGHDAPPAEAVPGATYLLFGEPRFDDPALGGSELLAREGGSDAFPAVPENPAAFVDALATAAADESTVAAHDVSHGGLAVTLAELVTDEAGIEAALPESAHPLAAVAEGTGRAVLGTTDPDAVRAAFDGVAPVTELGEGIEDSRLSLSLPGGTVALDAGEIRERRSVIEDRLS
jgi:phosphoribosylformylglycinamidine synthase